MTARKRIMVVEDDTTIRNLMTDILQDAGYEVSGYASAEEALSCIDSVRPVLITLDLAMPSMDGVEFLRLLRERSGDAGPSVVLVTAAPEFLRQELAQQGHRVLPKPFHVDQFLDTVDRALSPRESVA
ncbi:MAG: response regulator [Sphingomonadaceae bacterium]